MVACTRGPQPCSLATSSSNLLERDLVPRVCQLLGEVQNGSWARTQLEVQGAPAVPKGAAIWGANLQGRTAGGRELGRAPGI